MARLILLDLSGLQWAGLAIGLIAAAVVGAGLWAYHQVHLANRNSREPE